MASKTSLARRSVKVLLTRLAGNTEEQIAFLEFLKTVEGLFKRNKTFRDIVLNEQIPLEEKKKLFSQIVEGTPLTQKDLAVEFLTFLTRHHLFKYLPQIIRSYQYELENVLGTVKAEIESAAELPEELKSELVKRLEEKLGKKVEAEFSVNPDLIGGFVVRTTSFVVDASVKDLLRELALKI